MRLAYLLGTYPTPSETFIAREIAGLQARGHTVEIFSLFAPPAGKVPDVHYGWTTPLQRALRRLSPGAATRAVAQRWAARLNEVDLVVAHFASQPSSLLLDLPIVPPFIVSAHARDLYVEAARLAEKVARAAAVVTCTRANLDFLRARFPTDADRCHLVYHGLPAEWLSTPVPARPRMPDAPLRVLAVGRLVPKKGYARLLEACAHWQGVEVRILGDGPLFQELQALRARLGVAERVALDGWASPAQVRAAYAWADLLCCPSVLAADGDRDGLPNVVLEAMSTGLPVVGTRVSGIPEAVEDGVTGLLVSPGDAAALAAALRRCVDPTVRAAWGTAARARVVACFAATDWLAVLEAVFRQAAR